MGKRVTRFHGDRVPTPWSLTTDLRVIFRENPDTFGPDQHIAPGETVPLGDDVQLFECVHQDDRARMIHPQRGRERIHRSELGTDDHLGGTAYVVKIRSKLRAKPSERGLSGEESFAKRLLDSDIVGRARAVRSELGAPSVPCGG